MTAGEQLGFKTCEVNGMVIAKMEAAAHILGYSTPWGLSKLLSAYQIMTPEIGWFLPEVARKMKGSLLKRSQGLGPQVVVYKVHKVGHRSEIYK